MIGNGHAGFGRGGVGKGLTRAPRRHPYLTTFRLLLRFAQRNTGKQPGRTARLRAGLPVVSACLMFSRSFATVLLTLRRFLRASLSVVSRLERCDRPFSAVATLKVGRAIAFALRAGSRWRPENHARGPSGTSALPTKAATSQRTS